jgi:hypothetical protein
MKNFVTFQISSKLYWGFQHKILYDYCNNMTDDEIIKEIKTSMINFFTHPHDLYILKDGLKDLHLYIHENRPFSISKIVYVCDHCH